jgi:hypothetical protein
MRKIKTIFLFFSLTILFGCGTPNDPESIIGGDGGYKIVSKFPTSGYAQDVVVRDTLAFVTQGEGGLMIINIFDRRAPKEVLTLYEELKGYSNKVANKDSLVFVSAGAFGVSVIDASNLFDPVKATNISIRPAKGFDVMGDFVYTATGEYGFQVSKIVDINKLDPRGVTSTPGFAQAVCITADTSMLVACGEMGFSMFDVSHIIDGYGSGTFIGWVDTPGYAEDVVDHPDLPYAFLACGTGGFYVIDYSDSANVKVVGSYSTGGYAKEVVYKNNKAYVTTGLRGLQIFDVTNISTPVRIGTVQTKLAKGLAVDDKYIYVADEQEGLVIILIP